MERSALCWQGGGSWCPCCPCPCCCCWCPCPLLLQLLLRYSRGRSIQSPQKLNLMRRVRAHPP